MTADREWKSYPKQAAAPKGAPNVLLILSDDVGFGAASTFGGPVPTPAFDALAAAGLKYNQFYTTAMCSPTRASLLTGRNHHAVASGSIADIAVDEEGYTSVIPKSAATIARILKANGYDTALVGKNHNTPTWENSPMGPFDHWPIGMGFDYFYGFNGPYTDQFFPDLLENINHVRRPSGPDYILDRDLADHLINWLRMQRTLRPNNPFFAYFASASTHAPHQAPREWIDRFKGQFDHGWDKLRQEIYERQKKMGIIPADAGHNPRHDGLKSWDSLSPRLKRAYARTMEAFAGMLAYMDHQIGRVLEQLRKTGQLDNTLVIYIQGDNGASMENISGSIPEARIEAMSDKEFEQLVDDQGGPYVFGHYPAAWAWATNAPFPWGKRVASHLGGLRDGMVISWPAGIRSTGEVRNQFAHVIDIAPTIYEAAGIKPPQAIDGVSQQPIDGISLLYTFDDANAPERHTEQYFEMLGNRSYYKDGWMASTTPGRPPWIQEPGGPDPMMFAWELYNLKTDYSQTNDLSTDNPEKLAELRAAFDIAAERYHVYPLNGDIIGRMSPRYRPNLFGGRTRFTYYPGDTRYNGTAFPSMGPGWSLIAEVRVGGSPANGPILVQGDNMSGQALLLQDGKPIFVSKPQGERGRAVILRSLARLSEGDRKITVRLSAGTGPAIALELLVDDKPVASAEAAFYRPGRGGIYVGRRGLTPFVIDGTEMAERCSCEVLSVTIERDDM